MEQETRLATIVKDSNDAITVQDFAGNIREWNPSATRIYGYSEDEAKKMSNEVLVPQAEMRAYREMMISLRNGDFVDGFTTERLAKNGTIKSIWLTATALIDNNGRPYAIATTEHEI